MNPHQPAKDILSEYLQERGRRNRRNITVKCPECEGWKRVPNTGAAAYQPKYKDCPSCSASGIIVKPHIEEKLLPWAQRLEDALHKEFMEWWPTSEASRTRSPETSGTKWSDNPKQPVTHWLNVEDFLNERYPEAATGSKYGGEYAQPLIDKQLAADKQGTPQPTPEWLEAHGYIGTGNVITQAFLNLHNRYNRRPWKSKADKRRTYELLLRHIGPGAVKRDPLKAAAAAIKQAEAVLDCPQCDANTRHVHNAPATTGQDLYASGLVSRLEGEFNEWAEDSAKPNPYEQAALWKGTSRGPVGWWPNVESFLKERYPAAHKGFSMGMEDAQDALSDPDGDEDKPWLDGKRYETGPGAVEQYGYDPSEIAAAMLLLHNATHPGRDWLEADLGRITRIFQKRMEMNRAYEQTLADAKVALVTARRILGRDKPTAINPEPRTKVRPTLNWEATEPPQDPLPLDVPDTIDIPARTKRQRGVSLPVDRKPHVLWRGINLDLGHPGAQRIMRTLLGETFNEDTSGYLPGMPTDDEIVETWDNHDYTNTNLGQMILDHAETAYPKQGIGRHWTPYINEAKGWANDVNFHDGELLPVLFKSEWMGAGEDSRRRYTNGDWPDEGEITMLHGSPQRITQVYVQHPRTGKWHPVLGEPQNREASRRTSMPAPAPKGLRFEHTKPVHPHADYLGRVEAYVDDHPVGHIEWLKEGNPISLVTDRKPGEVSFVFVHPNYRRQSIATEMFDWAKKHVAPDLHHSERRTDLGQKWIGYEQGRELEKAATAIRQAQRILAMPAVDAYDGHIPRKKRLTEHDYIPSGPWYHGTDYELEDGTILVPGGGESKYTDTMYKHPDMKNRMKWVWLAPGPNLANRWGQHVYEVEPLDEGPWPWNGDGDSFTQFVVPRARVVRKLDLLSAAAGVFAHKTAMPAPTPKGLTFHHHTSLDTIPDQTGYDEENDEYWEYPRFWPPAVEVRLNGEYVGHLQWEDFGYPDEPAHGTVSDIHVEEPYRRRGIATALFDEAKRIEPKVHHSSERTELGKAWVQYEESRHKTAMPAPLPEGLHFKYHHTNDSIPPEYSGVRQGGSHTFLAPAVAAYIGDEPVGYVEWWPTRRYPNAMNHYRHTMDKGKPGEVYYIYVRPDLRRHSIATHMFDWAKQNAEPDLHHSPKRSELGKQWIGYEEGRELERAAAAIREANTILAKWKVDPNFFAAVHEMAHVLDAVSGFKASDTLDDALFPVYEAETGKKMSKEPGGHWMDYNNWMRRNLPGRAWEKRLDAYGFPLGFDDFNPKEAIASAFVEHEIHPEASTPAMRALHQHVVDHSAKAGRPTNLTTFRPFGKRPPDIAPEDDWDSGKLPRAFMDGVQHVFTKYPQSRIVDMVEPLEMSKHGPSPVTQTAFGNSWDNKPRIEYDDRASFYPELVDESFRRQRNDGVISPWMWQEDDDTLAKAAAVLRIAEPLADAYDPNAVWLDDYYPPDKAKPTPAGKWYHVSPHAIAPGTKLIPRGGETSFSYQEHPDDTWLLPPGRQDWVWMDTEKGAQSWLGILHMNGVENAYVYEVTPEVEGPWPYNGSGREGYVSPAATVVREIPHKDGKIQWDEIDQAEQAIKAASQILASEPMPLHRGVGFRKGDLPPELEQQFDAALAGEVHPEFVNNLLTHMHRDGEGMGGFWAHSKDGPWLAEGFSGRVQPDRWTNLPAHYSVVLSADWDGDNSIYDWNSDENYRKLLPGAKLRINRVRIKAPGIKKWIELGGDSTERYAQRTLTDDERREYESKGWRGQPCEDPDHHGIVMGRCADCGSIAMADEAIREAQKILAITEGVDYDDTAYWAAAWDDEDDEDEE